MKAYTAEWYATKSKTVQGASEADERYKELKKDSCVPKEIEKHLNLHDAILKEFYWDSKDLLMIFDVRHSGSFVVGARFVQAQLLSKEQISSNDHWLYEEIYGQPNAYELHILCCDSQDNTKETILLFEDVHFQLDMAKKKKQEEFIRQFLSKGK